MEYLALVHLYCIALALVMSWRARRRNSSSNSNAREKEGEECSFANGVDQTSYNRNDILFRVQLPEYTKGKMWVWNPW